MRTGRITAGSPEPLGVWPVGKGVNAAVFSAHATAIELCLFDAAGERELERIALPERTGDIWHGHVAGLAPGTRYGLRAYGPYEPQAGHRFNPHKLLVDPCAVALDRRFVLHPAMYGYRPGEWDLSFSDTDSAPFMPKAIVGDTGPVATAAPALRPWSETILYELNVRAFSKLNPDVPEVRRGTLSGLAHAASLGHLTRLGITAVELMPLAAFIDERHLGPLGLTNAWGYNPVSLSVPDPKLAPGGWAEVKAAVDALHAAGIEVIVDIVLNHTGEGDELGPTLSFRGLDNASYYRLNPAMPSRYIDDAGCGNCLALDRPPVVRLAMDAMRAWVRRAGIDGFRFDLATALGRRKEGFDPAAPLIQAIEQDPELRGRRLIAEPWDIGPGGYHAGAFPPAWGEWNDRYRDAARRFWRGDTHLTGEFATRLAGSSDLFSKKTPGRSINFIAAHDGFTLADLVAHTAKHNAANGEDNRDGTDANHSWNHGIEGDSNDPAIVAARRRDQINLLATLLLSRGTPMLSMGAETGHSQAGNNNAYAQDNPIGWLDWSQVDDVIVEATRRLISLRKQLGLTRDDRFLTGAPLALDEPADALWLRPDGLAMDETDWHQPDGETLVLLLSGDGGEREPGRVMLALNRGTAAHELALPGCGPDRVWSRVLDTSTPPEGWGEDEGPCASARLAPRSLCVLIESAAVISGRSARPAARPATIDRLASALGIAPDWWDVGGTHHPVSQETKRALLTAMGLDITSRGAARDTLEHLAQSRQRRRLPQALHATEGERISLTMALDGPIDRPPAALSLRDENGGKVSVAIAAESLSRQTEAGWDGRTYQSVRMTLPPLAAGRYRLTDEDDDMSASLTVAPARGWRPEGTDRYAGIAAQLYALRSAQDQGIGDLTTLALAAQTAARAGAATLGINPLHALFPADRSRVSPYHPSDRRFIDPMYIDVTALGDLPASPLTDALLAAAMPEFEALRACRMIDYPRLSALKMSILNARFEAFRTAFYGGRDGLRQDFIRFVEDGGTVLDRFATFRVIEAEHPGRPWRDWPDGLDQASSRATRDFAARHQQGLAREMFIQWLADRQLRQAAEAGRAAGLTLGLYRDLAVGCAPDGAEAWGEGDGYCHGVSVGAPPDPFSAEGQIWNLPPANPLTIARGGHATFRSLLAANMRHAGIMRIDHVMGLTRLFWVPDGAKGSEGAYVAYPRDALLAELKLESRRHRTMVVGEDLGTVPEGLRAALDGAGVLSYKVLWFEREGDRLRSPAHYPAASVACVSTHDLPTLAGWWSGADIAEQAALGLLDNEPAARARRKDEKSALMDACHAAGALAVLQSPDAPLASETAAALHRFIAAAPSLIAFVQTDDLAGETEAVNLPGTDTERLNWRRRLDIGSESLMQTPLAAGLMAAVATGRRPTNSLPTAPETAKERHEPPHPLAPAGQPAPADPFTGGAQPDAGTGPALAR